MEITFEFYNSTLVDTAKLSVDEKEVIGEYLYPKILNDIFGGDVDKMYKHFENNVQRIYLYGDNPEERLQNYCKYKCNNTAVLFNIKLIIKRFDN